MCVFYAWFRSLKGCIWFMFFLILKHLAVSSWMNRADSVTDMNTEFVIWCIVVFQWFLPHLLHFCL